MCVFVCVLKVKPSMMLGTTIKSQGFYGNNQREREREGSRRVGQTSADFLVSLITKKATAHKYL